MPQQVCMGAMMSCSFGAAPSSLVVLPINRVMTNHMPDANIMDNIPMVNILPFAMYSGNAGTLGSGIANGTYCQYACIK